MTDHSDFRKERTRRFFLAMGSSIVPKIVTLVTNFVAIPVAIAALGLDRFGLYSAAASFLAICSLAEVGIGPVLTQRISKAQVHGDRREIRQLFQTALSCVIATALVFGGLLVGGLRVLDRIGWAPQSFLSYRGTFYEATSIAVVLGVALIIAGVFNRLRAGYQELHITNGFSAAGNIVSLVALLVVSRISPSVEHMLLAVFGGPLLAGGANAIHLLLSKRYLLAGWDVAPSLIRPLVADGARYSFAQLSPIMHREAYKWVLVLQSDASAVGLYGALMQAVTAFAGVVLMISTPLLPAVSSALSRGDFTWIKKVWRFSSLFTLLYAGGILALCGIVFFTPLRSKIPVALLQRPDALLAFPFYFGAVCWTNIQFIMLVALGRIRETTPVLLLEYMTLVLGAGLLYALPSVTLALSILAMTIATIPARIYFSKVNLILRELSAAASGMTKGTIDPI